MMRILFDHQIFSYQAFGGASRYYCELMAELTLGGKAEVELGVHESPNEYLARSTFYRGKKISKGGKGAFLRAYARNALATTLASRRRRHDVLHATFYDPGALRDVRGGKLVVTVLDMIPERFPEQFAGGGLYGRLVTQRWIRGKRLLCEHADSILAISEATKRDLVEIYGTDPARVTVTHLGNRLVAGPGIAKPAGLPERYLLFVGMRGLYKNFEVVAAAMGGLPDHALVCIGGGTFTPEEQAMLAKHGIGSRTVQRSVRDDELAACYAHATGFVFSSRYEGFGIPILEAFACGCPAIVANASCFPEIAGDAGIYFEPDSVEGLRAVLRRVVDDPGYRDAMIAKGRARARRFTWEATAAQTYAAYQAVVG
jgi:glycosyltransferase involved in cell wall biosynthesis